MKLNGGEIEPGARKHVSNASFPNTAAASSMPAWYPELLPSVTRQVSIGRSKAIAAANQELLVSYLGIGRAILERQSLEGWGAKVIDRLSADLKSQFPAATGFSPRNLKYMRAFAAAWADEAIVQQPVAQLPWGHNVVLLDKLNDRESRLWYAAAAVEHGWSRNVLVHHIETKRMERARARRSTTSRRRCRRRTPTSPASSSTIRTCSTSSL